MNENLFSFERAKETLGQLWLPLNIIACCCMTALLIIQIYKIYKIAKEKRENETNN